MMDAGKGEGREQMSLGILVCGKVYGSVLQQSRSNDKPGGKMCH